MSDDAAQIQTIAMPVRSRPIASDEIVIGRDLLELITAAMYVDPLSIFREYVQNAVDAIDDASDAGLYIGATKPSVEITLDASSRSILIRDNGVSIAAADAPRRLLAIGASSKRGTGRRGFRGIGRLAGLGYCQELVFRGRTEGERGVFEVGWDARALRHALRADHDVRDLASTIQAVARVAKHVADGMPSRFFEVELRKVARIRNDVLLNPDLVAGYLGQIAPVPFRNDLRLGAQIQEFLAGHGLRRPIEITVNGGDPICRPHPPTFEVNAKIRDRFTEVAFIDIPGIESGTDAVGWVFDHGYYGSLAKSLRIGGLRVRSGDIQVGGADILAELFVEPRFNGWAVGEFHVLNPKIVPNGRRDDFEHNAHYANFQAHVTRLANDVARTCRSRSDARRAHRAVEERIGLIDKNLSIVRSIPEELPFRVNQLDAIQASLAKCERELRRHVSAGSAYDQLNAKLAALAKKIARARREKGSGKFLGRLPPGKRKVYAEILSALYATMKDIELAHDTVLRLLKSATAHRRRAGP